LPSQRYRHHSLPLHSGHTRVRQTWKFHIFESQFFSHFHLWSVNEAEIQKSVPLWPPYFIPSSTMGNISFLTPLHFSEMGTPRILFCCFLSNSG
jgi:hypothetical protein